VIKRTKHESKIRLDLPLTARLPPRRSVRRLLLRVSNPSRSIVLTLNPGLHVIDRPQPSPSSSASAAICFRSTRFIGRYRDYIPDIVNKAFSQWQIVHLCISECLLFSSLLFSSLRIVCNTEKQET